MKTTLFVLALLSYATLGEAQTAPMPTQAAAGTKNVGADRADAPQAPGMQQPPVTVPKPRRAKKTTGKRLAAPGTPAAPPKM